jgi:hypothetical protein
MGLHAIVQKRRDIVAALIQHHTQDVGPAADEPIFAILHHGPTRVFRFHDQDNPKQAFVLSIKIWYISVNELSGVQCHTVMTHVPRSSSCIE